MANIGSLLVEISASAKGFERTLDGATRSVSSFVGKVVKQIAKIGLVVAGALTGMAYLFNRSFSQAANSVDSLSKAAERLNIPLVELQKLNFAAALADVNPESFVRSMQLMGKNVFEAATKGGEAATVFTRLGINLQELNRLSADEQFRKIAESLQKVTSAGERSALQMQIFGRSGLELTNLLNGSLAETDKQFEKLGLGITTAQGKQVEAFNDTKTVLGMIFDGFKEQVAAKVSPAFTAINQWVIDSVEKIGGIESASTKFSIKIIEASIAGIKAFGELSKAATLFGLVIDNVMSKVAVLLAGFTRVASAASGLSFANKENAITPLSGDPSVIRSFANGVLSVTNNLIKVGQNVGEFSYKIANPEAEQLDKEFSMIHPGMEKYRKNQDLAAESIAKTSIATKELTQALLKAKADLVSGQSKTADVLKKSEELSGLFSGKPTGGATPASGASLFPGGRIPFSTDPKMDALLLKHAQDRAIIQKQFDDAIALRDKFPSAAFGTTGKGLSIPPTTPTLKIIMDTDGFFKFAQAPRFSGLITEIVSNAITDTATIGV